MQLGTIYSLSNPQTEEIRYIGQTRHTLKQRLSGHLCGSRCNKSNSFYTPVSKWIRKLTAAGLKPVITELQGAIPLDKLDESEIRWISVGKKCYRLLNLAPGGRIEGRKKGSKMSKEFCIQNAINALKITGTKHFLFKNRVGEKHHKLTVVKLHGFVKNRGSVWECICDCGKTTLVRNARINRTLSCGCARNDRWVRWRQLNEKKST